MKAHRLQAALVGTLAFGCRAEADDEAGTMASTSTSTSAGATVSTTAIGCDYEIYVDVGAVRLSEVDQWLDEDGEIYPQTCESACLLVVMDVAYDIYSCRILDAGISTGATSGETSTSDETTASESTTTTFGTTGAAVTTTDAGGTSITAGRAPTVLLECKWQHLCDWK